MGWCSDLVRQIILLVSYLERHWIRVSARAFGVMCGWFAEKGWRKVVESVHHWIRVSEWTGPGFGAVVVVLSVFGWTFWVKMRVLYADLPVAV